MNPLVKTQNMPALDELNRCCPPGATDKARDRFISDLSVSIPQIAEELGVHPLLVQNAAVEQKWAATRREHFSLEKDHELLQYEEMVRKHRLPTVGQQLTLVERLNKFIGKALDSEPATADSAKRLAEALDKTAAVAGRILNIRENLLEDRTQGNNNGGRANNIFILPGSKASRSEGATIVDCESVEARRFSEDAEAIDV